MNIHKLLIVLLSQFCLISALDMVEPTPELDSNQASIMTMLNSEKRDNGALTQIVKNALKSQENEQQEEMSWRAQYPDLNTGISFSAGVAVGGTVGFMLGMAAAGMFYGFLEL